MNRILTTIFTLFIPFLAYAQEHNPYPLSVTEGNSAGIVDGCVSAVSGVYFESYTNLIMPGPEPLVLTTSYASIPHFGWSKGMYSIVNYEGGNDVEGTKFKKGSVKYIEASGAGQFFSPPKNCGIQDLRSTLNLKDYGKGFTNSGRGEISARTHPKNTFIISGFNGHISKPKNEAIVYTSEGSKLNFTRNGKLFHDFGMIGLIYQLEKEIKPNGNTYQVIYDKTDGVNETKAIRTTNPSEKIVYAQVDHQHLDKKFERYFKASDGRELKYIKHSMVGTAPEVDERYMEIKRPNAPDVSFEYLKLAIPAQQYILVKRNLPDGRYRELDYYIAGLDHDPKYLRIKSLSSPVGPNGEKVITHTFHYNINKEGEGNTQVVDANGATVTYYIDKNLRLSSVQRPDHREVFTWGDKGTPNDGNLLVSTLYDSNSVKKHERTFTYDDYGNIIRDVFTGNICTEGSYDSYETTASFQTTGLYLKLAENDPAKSISYTYKPKTDLVDSRTTEFVDGTVIKETLSYDENSVLVQKVTDNGSERHTVHITPKAQTPCLGLPEVVAQYYLDQDGVDKLLSKTVYTYSREGWVTKEEHFDLENQLRYTIEKNYDNHGNPILEKDPLGQITTRKFDANDNLIYEKGPEDYHKEYQYDKGNRLTAEIIDHHNGNLLVTRHSYDPMGNRLSTTDWSGNTTLFTYDSSNRLIEKTHPDGSKESYSYDALGNMTSQTNALGYTTTTLYNSLNKPLKITYPDQTQVAYSYNTDGTLQKEISKEGVETLYTYDAQQRVVFKEKRDSRGQTLTTESYTYDAAHLLSHTNPRGYTTYYTYDKAGRKISEKFEGTEKYFFYDSLNRLIKTEEETSVKRYEYDLLGRVVQETTESREGEILLWNAYKYDADGNRIETLTEVDGVKSVEKAKYNANKQIVLEVDPLGHTTTYQYDYQYLNSQGDHVLLITETDPAGIVTKKMHDLRGNLVHSIQIDASNQKLSEQCDLYDSCNQRLHAEYSVIYDGQEERLYQVDWEYDPMGNVTQVVEENEKRTHLVFNALGQKEQSIKPDGKILFYTYDSLGRLRTLSSSDQSVSYVYHYDEADNLIKIDDLLQKQSTVRHYNSRNLLIYEKLQNGHTMGYHYDELGRVTQIDLFDQSHIDYEYDAHFLRKVRYGSLEHCYDQFDRGGNLLQETAFNRSVTKRTYDLKSQLTAIISPLFQEKEITYDSVGNIISFQATTPKQNSQFSFAYDGLNQLSSEQGGYRDQTYAHDSLNNRRKKNDNEYEVDHLNRLNSEEFVHYSYDPNGNMIQKSRTGTTVKYHYDVLDRLIMIETANKKTVYAYDSFNRRLSRNERSYLYMGSIEIGSVESGELVDLRILGRTPQKDVGASVAHILAGRVYYPHHDHIGSVRVLEDENHKPVGQYEYSVFGEEYLEGQVVTPWRFSSKRKDGEFIHFGCRDYNPRIGRWMTPDPIGFDDGPNLYAYVHNNPLTHVDLHGLFSYTRFGSGAAYGSYDTVTAPIGTLGRYARYSQMLASCTWNRDFSPITTRWNAMDDDKKSEWLGRRFGELGTTAAAAYVGAEIAGSRMVTGTFAAARQASVSTFSGTRGYLGSTAVGTSYARAASRVQNSTRSLSSNSGSTFAKNHSYSSPVGQTSSRGILKPDLKAKGDHSVFRVDTKTGKVYKYETYTPQKNPQNPNPWSIVKRYHGLSSNKTPSYHYNKALGKKIYEPHVHDSTCPGGVRIPEYWEFPN